MWEPCTPKLSYQNSGSFKQQTRSYIYKSEILTQTNYLDVYFCQIYNVSASRQNSATLIILVSLY